MPRFRNLIFDLDGLIVDTEPLYKRSANLILEVCGVDYRFETEEYGRIFTGRAVAENAEYLRERFGLPQTAAQITTAVFALYNMLIADAENLVMMPGVRELLDYAAQSSIRMAIATSARPEQIEVVLRGLNLQHQFNALAGNPGHLKPKPAPDVYLEALRALDARAEESAAFEDSSSGVRAAKAAGLFVFAVPNEFTKHQDFSMADRVQSSLVNVLNFLPSSH